MSDTRPSPDTPEELIWLRGFEAGVIRCRADRNQVIQELIEKAEADGRTFQLSKPISECLDRRQRAQGAADWLKSQIEGE